MKQAEIDKFIDYVKRFCLAKKPDVKYWVIEAGQHEPFTFKVEVLLRTDKE